MEKSAILITGALGHIGSALIRQFPALFPNAHLVLIDDLRAQRYCSLFNLPESGAYTFIEGCVQDLDLTPYLTSARTVVHLAALTDASGTADTPDKVHQNNFHATHVLAESCLEAGVPLIFPSSTSVYGSQANEVDETCEELVPQSPYATCKLKEEALLQGLFQKGLKGAILRLGTIYGTSPGMRFHTAVNKFCWQAVMGQKLTVWETAMDQKRPYLCVQDAVRAFGHAIKQELYAGDLYNVVSGNHTVRAVIDEIQQVVHTLSVDYVAHRIMNQLSYCVRANRFQERGFAFQGQLHMGIHETVALLKQARSTAW